ncbi:MAG TPA: hypothetical protein VNY73_03415 [Bacteroidia bacterium]|jgi:hypothetical protein|nr:hypothetical protein [Bacteroidia bacterium]
MSKSKKDILSLIEKGLALSFKKLVEKTIKNNGVLVFSDGKGNPILVKAKDLKNRS